ERGGGDPGAQGVAPTRGEQGDHRRGGAGGAGPGPGAKALGGRGGQGGPPEATEPAELAGRELLAGGQRFPKPAEKPDQGQDVVPVVGKHAAEWRGPPRAQEVEVERRDQTAGDVVFSNDADDFSLEGGQTAIGQVRVPYAPSRTQEVEVRQGRRPAPARHDEARL